MATKLSENFTFEEFYAKSDTAKKYNINNYPNPSEQANIKALVEKILQPVRSKFGSAITVTCGFRCPKLNTLVGGAAGSQHLSGSAADIKASNGKNAELFNLILKMIDAGEIEVGQLIWEYGTKVQPQWIHVSLPYSKRNQILRAVKVNGRTQYPLYR